jgi:hypothetical protein
MALLLPAETAWYVTGRFYETQDKMLADYGYFLHLAGLGETALFNDRKWSESTAHFTFAAEPFKACGVTNGVLGLSLDPVGEFSVYLQRAPAGDFNHPLSFAEGQRIARFRRASVVMGTAVGGHDPKHGLLSNNVFTARLIHSEPFEFGGRKHDLADILGPGITQFGTAAAVPITPPADGYVLVVPFSGSAIALGRA